MFETTVDKPSKLVNILIADDDDNDRKRMKNALKLAGVPCICTDASSIEDALKACQECSFDCALVDYRLTGQDGLDGITALHERLPYMAIIMITGQGNETVAVEAMKRGALDYMAKKNMDVRSLRRSVENAIAKASLLRTVAEQRNELEGFNRVLVHDLKSPIASARICRFDRRKYSRRGPGRDPLLLQQSDRGHKAYGHPD